ncbi:hypothetical protein N9545_04730 [Salibacteraceae bacterium]|jgi:hypothetical protein|nr:hypothetical protein [Salibacteraceae bacterium]MDB9708861.1 hypothetical protein [Salibacteraceae bacterium]MDC1304661.1 hypothetical protein [Salibacteraceae bacterium]
MGINQHYSQALTEFNFFQIYFETENGKLFNNDSILTPENWEKNKKTFFKQRMEQYDNAYTLTEKIQTELDRIEGVSIIRQDYKILLGRYIKYLKACKNESGSALQQKEKNTGKLTMTQIALVFVYSGKQITRDNGDSIASEYGHSSGEALFQKFTKYSSPANRKGKPQPCTPKKLQNKIDLLNSVIELLPTKDQKRVKDEVQILINIQEAEYQ